MEHNVLSKAVESVLQSLYSVSSWCNTLTDSLKDHIKLKESKSYNGNISCQLFLEMERRTSAPDCTLHHVDSTNSNIFRNSEKSFRRENLTTGITNCIMIPMSSNQAINKDETFRMDNMFTSSNIEVGLMNGHLVEENAILLKKDPLHKVCTPISTASDSLSNVTNEYNQINAGTSCKGAMNGEETQGNRNKIFKVFEQIRDFRFVTPWNNEISIKSGRPNSLSVLNPSDKNKVSLLEEEEEETSIHDFRQRSRTYDCTEQRLSAYNDLREAVSDDNKNNVPLKSYRQNSYSRRDKAVDVYSDNYSLYAGCVLKSKKEREKHTTSNEVSNESEMESLKVCVQHFETIKMLRVIVLTASNLNAPKGHIYPRLTVHYGIATRKSKQLTLPKVMANTQVVFNAACFFENINEEKIETLILKVRLYQKKGVFKFKKCLGQLVIPVFKYDLSMDTHIKGKLKKKNSQKISVKFDEHNYDNDDIEVISDDRSISATVAEAVKPGSRYSSTRYRRRVNSLPIRMVPFRMMH